MKIQFFQHVPFEGLGSIEEWIIQRGHSLETTRFYKEDKIPSINDFDNLIIMGGPMSAHDEKIYPWLKQEKVFIQEVIENGKAIIGICLGAQLIADVLGAKVYPNKEKEIGWFPIRFTEYAKQFNAFTNISPDYTVFHWHGDTFDLPGEAKHLAYSEGCRNQAFVYDKKILGLQFHLETTNESLSQMLLHGKNELIPGKFIQPEKQILSQKKVMAENKRLLFSILDDVSGRN
ncbi:MAG: type 1 glutamine amidotransferase [Chitinophagaceae bacterium]